MERQRNPGRSDGFAVSILFSSCENFLNGSELKQNLDSKIEYEKSESFNVRVFADFGTGTIVSGGGDKSYRVSDKFTVEFSPSDDYKFIKWTAQDKDSLADLSDCVEFGDTKNTLTTVKIKKSGNIQIKPICLERPKIENFEPQRSQAEVPKNSTIKITINRAMNLSSEGIPLKSSFQKFYFTGATIDSDPPDFVDLEVEQLLENGSWTKVEKKDNVDHTKPNNFKSLNIGATDLKVKVKGVVTDTGNKPAKLKVFLDPLYTDYYDGQQKIEVGEKSLPSAGAIAEFPEGIEFDFSEKDIPQGIYLLSVAAVDNAGKEKVESFKMVYDYTPPEVSELTYVSTYAQDRVTVGRRNETRDIYKTEITGFKDNSIKTVTRDENVELIGLAGAAPSRTHTITLKEYDYLGNYATYTKVVQAIPEPGMYYFSDDYWTKDKSKRDWGLWGIITSQGFGKNKDEYTNVKILSHFQNFMFYYGPRDIAPWDSYKMSSDDGLKALKYVIKNYDYEKLRVSTIYKEPYTYSTIWSQCDYERKRQER